MIFLALEPLKQVSADLNKANEVLALIQWRRHGEDWGGHVPPNSLQGQFSNLSKSGKKNGGGGGYVCDISPVI